MRHLLALILGSLLALTVACTTPPEPSDPGDGPPITDEGISTIERPPQQEAEPTVLEPSEVSAPRISNAPVVIEAETPVIDQAPPPTRAQLAELRARLHRSLITDFDHRGLAELPLEEARPIVIAMARQLVDTDVPDSFGGSRVQLLNELVDDRQAGQ